MHAHLIVGHKEEEIEASIEELVSKNKSKILEFKMHKISEVRELGQIVKLSDPGNRSILIRDFDEATLEAMNAFLKLLEEPKEGLNYILTAKKTGDLLPTILSRLNIIKVGVQNDIETEIAIDFINKTLTDKLNTIDSIKKRKEANNFLQDFIYSAHKLLNSNKNYKLNKLKTALEEAISSHSAIKKNGNVNLHLSKFVLLIDR